jgi:hypothetical protein
MVAPISFSYWCPQQFVGQLPAISRIRAESEDGIFSFDERWKTFVCWPGSSD